MHIRSVIKQKINLSFLPSRTLLWLICCLLPLSLQECVPAWAQSTTGHRPTPQFLSLGASACMANADITRARNRQRLAQPLDTTAQYYLRPWFGALVDSVRVVWQAKLNDRLVLGRRVVGQGSRAQTYGYQIYVAPSQSPRDPGDPLQLLLLAHELVHTEQFMRYGARLTRFCQAYVAAWEHSAGVYADNPLEQEAFDKAFAFAQWLAQQLPATPQGERLLYTHEGEGPQGRQLALPRRLPLVASVSPQALRLPRARP